MLPEHVHLVSFTQSRAPTMTMQQIHEQLILNSYHLFPKTDNMRVQNILQYRTNMLHNIFKL